MKVIVKPHKIELIKEESVNEKEINISKCKFEFDERITEEYTKEAYFTLNDKTYKKIIINNECDFPSEILSEEGIVELGVVAFLVEGNEEITRFNPTPVRFPTMLGSLKENAENSSTPTPSELEQLESILTNKQDKLVNGVSIKTINGQSILGEGNINIEGGEGGTSELSTEVKNAILDCFENVAWTSASGKDYYDVLSDLFFPPEGLTSISAVFNQGERAIYIDDSLDSLKDNLVVTANYTNGSTRVLSANDYTLSGVLTAGTSTITVSYNELTDTFDVVVNLLPSAYQQVEWIKNTGDARNYILPSYKLPTAFRIEAKAQLDKYNSKSTYGNIAAVYQGGLKTYGMELAYKKEDSSVIFFMGTQSIVFPTNINSELVIGGICTGSKSKCYVEVDGTTVYGEEVDVSREYNTNNLGIFYGGDSANQLVGKIFYCKVYDLNDNLLANFVPCYLKSDGTVGLYDTVANAFYINSGTGTLMKGADINE